MSAEKLLDLAQPPTCLHALGQSLVDAMWREGQELKVHAPLVESLRNCNNAYRKGIITDQEFQARCTELVEEHFHKIKSNANLPSLS